MTHPSPDGGRRGPIDVILSNIDRAIIPFAIVGLIATLIDFGLFSWLVALGAPVAAANIGSYLTSLGVNFGLNHAWTFAKSAAPAPITTRAMRFVGVHAISLTLSTAIVAALALVLPALLAKAFSIPIVFVWNFFAVKRWAFKSQQ